MYNSIMGEQFIVLKQSTSGAKFFIDMIEADSDVLCESMYKD